MGKKKKGIREPLVWSLMAALLATLHNLYASLSTSLRRKLWSRDIEHVHSVEFSSLVSRQLSAKETAEKQEASFDGGDDHQDNDDDDNQQHDSTISTQGSRGAVDGESSLSTKNQPIMSQKEWTRLNRRLAEQRLRDFFPRDAPDKFYLFQ